MKRKLTLETTSTSLHILAMAIMLIDHLKRVFPDVGLLPCVGRIAFPIFAFLIVEGYHHTRDLKKYAQRLLLFALLAEIPFNLMAGSTLFYPAHQNVLWTFLVGLLLIHINEKVKQRGSFTLRVPVAVVTVVVGYWIGKLTNVDYMQAGVLTVLMFYFFRGRRWWNFVLQFAALAYINFEMLGSYAMEFTIWGHAFSFPRQGLAMLALIPIWLYRGKQGCSSKWLRLLNYAFYPGHMLVIAVLAGTASPYVLLVFPVLILGAVVWRLIGEKGRYAVKLKLEELVGPAVAALVIYSVVSLLYAAPFLSMLNITVDTVTIKYVTDFTTWEKGSYTRAISSQDQDVIAEWLAFCDETIPEEKQTDINVISRAFPAYVIEFRKGNKCVIQLAVTQLESVIYKEFSEGKYVGYAPLNPYYEQAASMMATLEGA